MLKMCQILYAWTCKKRVFEWNGCQKSLKPEVPTSTKNIKKLCWNEAQIHEKSVPELNKKQSLKTEFKKIKKYSKNDPEMVPKE